MRVVIFGASGMVGQGILLECLLAPDVTEVLSVSRTRLSSIPNGVSHTSLHEIVRPDLFAAQDFTPIAEQLTGLDACFFPLGVSAFRMSEKDYTHITRDLTLSVAQTLAQASPGIVFCYVSGQGTNAASKTMWARVKGQTELALQALPFRAVYLFRPGAIIPQNGIRSRTPVYNLLYNVLRPVFWMLSRSEKLASTTQTVGLAMLNVVRRLPPQHTLQNADINRIARGAEAAASSNR